MRSVNGFNSRCLHVITGQYYRVTATSPDYDLLRAIGQHRLRYLVLRHMKKKMNLFGYTYKIYDIGYKTEMTSTECNSGDPLETPGGLYRGPPSNENTIFKKMCMPNIKFKSVQCSFTMNVNQLQ